MALATLTLEDFCATAGKIVHRSAAADIPARIADALPGLLANDDILQPQHRAAPECGYGRNRLFICPVGAFSILAMVWPAGVTTPIHDHHSWCAFGVYEGTIDERRYVSADDDPDCRRVVERSAAMRDVGTVGHLPTCQNIHSLHNCYGATAISIHIYGGDARHTGPNLGHIYSL